MRASPCRWVDEIITDAPWVITEEFINLHKVDFVTHDALPYADASGQAADVYDFVRRPLHLGLRCLRVMCPDVAWQLLGNGSLQSGGIASPWNLLAAVVGMRGHACVKSLASAHNMAARRTFLDREPEGTADGCR